MVENTRAPAPSLRRALLVRRALLARRALLVRGPS